MQNLVVTGDEVGLGDGVRNYDNGNIGSLVSGGIVLVMLGSCLGGVFLHGFFLVGNLNLVDGDIGLAFTLGLEGQCCDLGAKVLVSTAADDADGVAFYGNGAVVRLDCAVIALVLQFVAVEGQSQVVSIVRSNTGVGVAGDLHMDNCGTAVLSRNVSGGSETVADHFSQLAPLTLTVYIMMGNALAGDEGFSSGDEFATFTGFVVDGTGLAGSSILQILVRSNFLVVNVGMLLLEGRGQDNILLRHYEHKVICDLAVDIVSAGGSVAFISLYLHENSFTSLSLGNFVTIFITGIDGTTDHILVDANVVLF